MTRIATNDVPCSFPECGGESYAKTYCKSHYAQLLSGKPLRPVKRRVPKPVRLCSFDPCGNRHHAKGWCATHYQHYLDGIEPFEIVSPANCSYPACDKPYAGAGYCGPHYHQLYRKEELRPLGNKRVGTSWAEEKMRYLIKELDDSYLLSEEPLKLPDVLFDSGRKMSVDIVYVSMTNGRVIFVEFDGPWHKLEDKYELDRQKVSKLLESYSDALVVKVRVDGLKPLDIDDVRYKEIQVIESDLVEAVRCIDEWVKVSNSQLTLS